MQRFHLAVPGARIDVAARLIQEYFDWHSQFVPSPGRREYLYFDIARATGLPLAEVERVLVKLEGSTNALTVVHGDFDRACREAAKTADMIGKNAARMSLSARMAADFRRRSNAPPEFRPSTVWHEE